MRAAFLLCVAITIALGLGCAAQQRIPLGPETLIVVPPGEPDEETGEAARLLQACLRKATANATGFAIVSEDALAPPITKPAIALGNTQWVEAHGLDDLGRNGYRVRRVGTVIAIAGGTSRGTFHGTVAFLDRVCGVRFYLPGDLFVSLPSDGRVTVGDVDFSERPFVASCVLSGIAEQGPLEADWVKRAGGLRALGGTFEPNLHTVLFSNLSAEKFPEIYPILDGERHSPADADASDWQPCFSAPTLVDAALEAAAEHFRAHPEDAYISFGTEDNDRFCECGTCKAIMSAYLSNDAQRGRRRAHAVLYWRFLNAVAGRLERIAPGKRIVGMGRGQADAELPFDLHPSIVVFTQHHVTATAEKHISDSAGQILPDRWLEMDAGYGNKDEYLGGGFLLPRMYGNRWARFLRRVKARREDMYLDVACTPNWALDGPKLYILSRLCWNPDEDPDELRDRFCKDMFGPAARPMAEYFRTLEALCEQLEKENPKRSPYAWGTQFDTTARSMALIRKARRHLEEAAVRVWTLASVGAAASPAEQRVAFFSRGFRVTEYLVRIAATETPSNALLAQTESWMTDLLTEHPLAIHRPALEDALDAIFPDR